MGENPRSRLAYFIQGLGYTQLPICITWWAHGLC